MDPNARHRFERTAQGSVAGLWRQRGTAVERWNGSAWVASPEPLPAGDDVDAEAVGVWLGTGQEASPPPRRRRMSSARLRTVFGTTFLATVGIGVALGAVGLLRMGDGPGTVPWSSLFLGAGMLAAVVTFLVHRQRRILDPATRVGLAAIVATADARAAVVTWRGGAPAVVRVLCTDAELDEQRVRGLRPHERLIVPRDVL